MTLTEAPYTEKREKVFALAAPFAEAIRQWLAHQDCGAVDAWGYRNPHNTRRAGVKQLAELSGVPARRICDYLNGRARYIELVNADRLALALDIPLSFLAEDFKSIRKMIDEERRTAA